ncbi:MAG TPA: bifunctional methylenetetrahydrofolate dehydrogenase/methenyltetrahydrofolate cyclohydrolase FolD [Clostridia bacterium]|nr:bifunctional methylenetetrahydrofolate dehydrogenase/methenyltetrahydrofolate cyclohydrolase FolD [Clostridia bacterium]
MNAQIIDGKALSIQIKENLKNEAVKLKEKGIEPCLAVILAGESPASQIYVRNKIKSAEETGIKSLSYYFDDNVSEDELIDTIHKLNADSSVHGILVQLPIPQGLNEARVLKEISDEKDVDGFSAYSVGQLLLGREGFVSCTPLGVIELIKSTGETISGKDAVIIGRSNIVGKPLMALLLRENATVTVCHSKTQNLAEKTRGADILIAAIGKAKFVTEDMVKEGAVVIDVGINRVDGKVVGDVDFETVKNKAKFITPVPGGVGPMTIAMLLKNTIISANKSLKNSK